MVSSEDKYSHKSADKHPKGCGHANNISTQNVKWHPTWTESKNYTNPLPGNTLHNSQNLKQNHVR